VGLRGSVRWESLATWGACELGGFLLGLAAQQKSCVEHHCLAGVVSGTTKNQQDGLGEAGLDEEGTMPRGAK
jgi:hypothetical protein